MNEFIFEETPWDAYIDSIQSSGNASASVLLTMLENENDDVIDGVFEDIFDRKISLNVETLPQYASGGKLANQLIQEEQMVKRGISVTELAETDPLRLYLEEIAALPAIGDEQMLAQQYASGRKEVASELTNLGLSRVVKLAQEYVGHGVLLIDLIQEGNVGLWQGIAGYHSGDYIQSIRYSIHHYLSKAVFLQAKNSGIGHKMRQAIQDYRSADEKLVMELGRNPSVPELADALHMTVDEVEAVRKMMNDALLINQVNRSTEEDEPEDSNSAVEDTAYFQMRQRIAELLSVLDEQHAKILSLRFGLDQSLPLTAEQTAQKLGLSVQQVMTKEAEALALLRKNK